MAIVQRYISHIKPRPLGLHLTDLTETNMPQISVDVASINNNKGGSIIHFFLYKRVANDNLQLSFAGI